jgi:hypothetical protein
VRSARVGWYSVVGLVVEVVFVGGAASSGSESERLRERSKRFGSVDSESIFPN